MTQHFPRPKLLAGQCLRMRPICSSDLEPLGIAASDPRIWDQHPTTDRHTPAGFATWFERALAERALVVEDAQTDVLIGSSRYYDWQPESRAVAIGHTFSVRRCWGGVYNTEMKRLMLDHAFQHVDTVWFHVAVGNHRSRRAMEKIGGVWDHDGVLEGLPYHYMRIDRPQSLRQA